MKNAIVRNGLRQDSVSGACFAEMGLDITCVDIDAEKIEGLNAGVIPIYEPGLEELVRRNVEAGRLHFTTDLTECLPHVEVVFSAVGTPPDEDGSADLEYVSRRGPHLRSPHRPIHACWSPRAPSPWARRRKCAP